MSRAAQPAENGEALDQKSAKGIVKAIRQEITTVPISSLRRGDSPRLSGEDKAHITRLAETETALPPILVDRRGLRVIDGMHRLLAASLRGQETIEVEFFDGNADEAFMRAVRENVRHGYPLSRADRSAAAARIMKAHPSMSDRAIAELSGLAAKTVARIRQRSTAAVPQLNRRIGRDGRVRPISSAEGRLRAAGLLAERPQLSLREVAREAMISPATARDVKRRLERGEEPTTRDSTGEHGDAVAGADRISQRNGVPQPRVAQEGRVVPSNAASVLEKLLRDPSLRHNEQGRRLLRLLRDNFRAQNRMGITPAVPSHCAALVAQLARQYAQMWADVAQELEERAQVSGLAVAQGQCGT